MDCHTHSVLITLFWASLNATKQQDLKGILAFSTVSQLGMIMAMLGIGAISYHYQGDDSKIYAAAFTAAIFHLINHATFKGALFYDYRRSGSFYWYT